MTDNNRLLIATLILAAWGISSTGCFGPKQPEFETLHPVSGKVQKGGVPVSGGALRFTAVPENPDFMIVSDVKEDGTFSLATVRSTDSRGEKKPGAPAGEYTVVYTPPNLDQTQGFSPPVTLPAKITIKPETNELTLELP
jgi:hypothetical protein